MNMLKKEVVVYQVYNGLMEEELNGVTLESLVVAERVARAMKAAAKRGIVDEKDFPLLMHVDEIICQKKEVNLPWEKFTFNYEK